MTLSFHIGRKFFDTAFIHPQKVAVVLDDQAWTYGELIEYVERVVCHVQHLKIVPGQIIYQFVERSFEMICGFFGILCAGGVYCPLNPSDPPERLALLLAQMQGQCVLLHKQTRERFPLVTVQHVVLLDDILLSSVDIEDVRYLPVCREYDPAYVICTSGTTGRQKAIVHTHRSFSAAITAYGQWDIDMYTERDQVLQVAVCSWAVHLLEISSTLIFGGTLVLLRPGGHLDMDYFSRTVIHHQVTTLTIGPAIIRAITNYLEMSQRLATFECVRNLCTSGESVKPQQWIQFIKFVSSSNTRILGAYGMSECNTVLGCQLVDITDTVVPIGYPLPGVHCLLIDQQGQKIGPTNNLGEIGQIHIGGSVLFNGYLDDPERTATTLINIDNIVYLQTGDLARYNARGELVHVGRVDFQIKIHGQRVEAAEIENTIINFSPSKVVNCLVTKSSQNDDMLIAYVMSNDLDLDTGKLRDHCNKYLRQYMVPSYFVVLDKFPLNANGKVDRKQLPLPSMRSDTRTSFVSMEDQPMLDLEEKVHSLWCSTLRLDMVSRHSNCFALGGSSLLLMQLFNYYQFHLAPDKQLDVLDFFINPTIAEHVQLLTNSKFKTQTVWKPLHLVHGPASYAQENIWLAEQVRFIEQTPPILIYNSRSIYRIDSGRLSIKQCLGAVDLIVARHSVLRTQLIFDVENGQLEQSILQVAGNARRLYTVCLSTVQSEQEFRALRVQETLMPIENGVVRCHFVRYDHTDEDILKSGDFIIFTFHHGSFDATAADVFSDEFVLAYSGKCDVEEPFLQYIDYAMYERTNVDFSAAREYWNATLRGYSWDCKVDLPYDYNCPVSARRSGWCGIIRTVIPVQIMDATIARAKEFNATLLQLTLTCFYIFLVQLSPRNQDACVSVPIRNRYRPELEKMIGMFVNMLPCRVNFDASSTSTVTFVDLLHKVQNNLINTMKHGNLPYLELLELHRTSSSSLQFPFLDIYFTSIEKHESRLIIPSVDGDSCSLSPYYPRIDARDKNTSVISNMFDTDVTVGVDMAKKVMWLTWTYSTDLFTYTTIDMLSKRFVSLLNDLFVVTSPQQLGVTPLVKLIPMANEPINLSIHNQHEQRSRITKVLTSLEQHIQAVFSHVLDTQQVDVNRSFFEQGGTSLKAVQAIYLLQRNPMTAMVDADLFFTTLSVAELARTIETSR